MPADQEWDDVLDAWSPASAHARLRDYSDAVTLALLERWLGGARFQRVLKTDVFDEATGVGLFPYLRSRAKTVVGVDVSSGAIARAVAQYPELRAEQGDIRALACADGEFDLVVSNSTLDHLESLDDIRSGLAELYRVLRPGGVLVLTLDNVANPGVALRNRFSGLLRRLGVVPYPLGVTCGPKLARALVCEAGFDVVATGATMHVPRVLVLSMARVFRRGGTGENRLLRVLLGFERLSQLPTRYLTGQYLALSATKPVHEPKRKAAPARRATAT